MIKNMNEDVQDIILNKNIITLKTQLLEVNHNIVNHDKIEIYYNNFIRILDTYYVSNFEILENEDIIIYFTVIGLEGIRICKKLIKFGDD